MHWARLEASALVRLIAACPAWKRREERGGCSFWQPVQADSQPKSSGLVLGRRLLGAVLHSSNEPGELSQWLYHDDSTINIVLDIIIITIINPSHTRNWNTVVCIIIDTCIYNACTFSSDTESEAPNYLFEADRTICSGFTAKKWFQHLCPGPLTFQHPTPKLIVSRSCPVNHLCQFASKISSSFSKYSKFRNR